MYASSFQLLRGVPTPEITEDRFSSVNPKGYAVSAPKSLWGREAGGTWELHGSLGVTSGSGQTALKVTKAKESGLGAVP